VPTWNYTAVHIHGLATVLEDPAVRWSVMDRLVASAEAKYGQGWTAQADALGSQFDQIVVFQIDVQKTEAKFKLSQQQNPGVRQNVAEQLQRSPFANSRAVGDLMAGRKANQGKEGNLLEWARRLQALAQNGLAFTKDPFDKDRYEAIRNLAAEMIASDTGIEVEVIREIFLQDAGYATPKIDVRGAVFRDDTLLLVRERSDGKWTVPGGYADIGYSPSEAAVKEVREESGYLTRATKILMAYDKRKQDHPAELRHIYKLFYLCELLGGEPKPDQEISEVGFFGENEIPELSLARVTPNQIKRLFHHHRTPNLPTDFD
jgi:ADP-ribose pyrophosphatase YjhB (NUDIX family)